MERNRGLRLAVAIAACVFMLIMSITVFAITTSPSDIPTAPTTEATTESTTVPTTAPTEPTVVITIEELVQESFQDIEYVEPQNKDEAINYITLLDEYIQEIYCVNSKYFEDPDTAESYAIVSAEVERIMAIQEQYTNDIAVFEEEERIAAHWEKCAAEYPAATEVWLYMKNEFGWSDIVCAGIVGNMMAECGGCWSSDLDWDINASHGLGMIQWIGGRRREIISIYGKNPSIEEQLLFMRDELYGTNGVTKQVQDWQLEKIMNAETPEDCAYYFAHYFERCNDEHKPPRRGYARRAYNYFVIE